MEWLRDAPNSEKNSKREIHCKMGVYDELLRVDLQFDDCALGMKPHCGTLVALSLFQVSPITGDVAVGGWRTTVAGERLRFYLFFCEKGSEGSVVLDLFRKQTFPVIFTYMDAPLTDPFRCFSDGAKKGISVFLPRKSPMQIRIE